MAVDPIEKKPLFHFHPGAITMSYSTVGCNLSCVFCQNYSISQADLAVRRTRYVEPGQLVEAAAADQCRIIAHTYTEPTVYLEYALDIARLAVRKGLLNVFVTNGFISPEALAEVVPLLHGANVDLKSFNDATYRRWCNGRLQPVLDTIAALRNAGVWVEVTTLVIPQLNDSPEELRKLASFIASLDPAIPWHVSRFHPDFRMCDRGLTPASTLEQALDIGRRAGLRYVYAGNLRATPLENTCCHSCGQELVRRQGFVVKDNRIAGAACPACGEPVAGIWS